MTFDQEREQRWIAYALGDLDPEEREAIQAEMAKDPETAASVQHAVNLVRQWAKSPVELPESPTSAVERESGKRAGAMQSVPRWFWGAAAAALLLVAVAQTQFTLTVGDTTFSWGATEQQALDNGVSERLDLVADRLAALETQSQDTVAALQSYFVQNVALERDFREAVAQLERNQQIESLTRYEDMRRLVQLAGLEFNPDIAWISQAADEH